MTPQRKPSVARKTKSRGQQAPALSTHRTSVDDIRAYFESTLSSKYKPALPSSNSRTIVAIGDLHGNPHEVLLPQIIAANPHLILLGGDALDLALFSAHPKEWGERTTEFEVELKRVVAYLQVLLTRTRARIIILRGNHDNRVYRQLCDLIPDHLRTFITVSDPLELVVKGLNSDRVSLNMQTITAHHPRLPESEMGRTAYLYPLGDAVLSHCNFSGSEPGAAVGKLSKWMDEWHQMLGWPEPRLLIQFHSHQWSYQFKRGGFLCLVEPGMGGMPAIEGYKVSYQAKWKPGTLGAVSFRQTKVNDQWVTALETVHPLIP